MSTLRQITPSPPRTPLQDTTNGMSPEPSSPIFHTAKTNQSTKTRRRFSLPFFRPQNLDSSEDLPSPHSSLWDAPLANETIYTAIPNGNWDASVADITPRPTTLDTKPKKKGRRKGKAKPTSPPVAIQPPALERSHTQSVNLDPNVHHPHLLDTITERSSLPTLRSQHPSIRSLQQRTPSATTLRLRTSALHKKSFSVSDIPAPIHSPPDSSSKSSVSSQNYTIETLPNAPIEDPPERMPTPPGLPKFNTPEAINYRLPSPHLSFREKFRRHPTPEEITYHRQTAHLPPGVVMRGEGGELIRGRWRQGGLSGHTGYGNQGALDAHPFNRAPMAGIASEEDAAVEARPRDAPHTETAPAAGPTTRNRKGTRWQRFVEATCFVCCGVERGPDGQVMPAVVPQSGRAEPTASQPMMTGARGMEERGSPRRDRFQRVGGDGWMY
ncbi:MAG: hypothetical protein L6R42_001755 [Xanthoria sp. 1 TBL-2021]|nr:MAG: hypothetical protein L6R42_001755 [Xanthoria sp. 1 TBL-2021]